MTASVAPAPEGGIERGSPWPLLAALTLSSLGIGVSLPIIPLFALDIGAVPFVVGLIVSLRWATRLVADILDRVHGGHDVAPVRRPADELLAQRRGTRGSARIERQQARRLELAPQEAGRRLQVRDIG